MHKTAALALTEFLSDRHDKTITWRHCGDCPDIHGRTYVWAVKEGETEVNGSMLYLALAEFSEDWRGFRFDILRESSSRFSRTDCPIKLLELAPVPENCPWCLKWRNKVRKRNRLPAIEITAPNQATLFQD